MSTARPPLIVVGMHRSGTSFVSSLLHRAGIDMGSRLMPPARGNERGHYENLDFVDFHMRELRLTGHDDAGWAAMKPLRLPDEATAEANDLIATNAGDGAWGWKDPRTTLFLDFWSGIVSDANFLYIYREPVEVIDSLYRRGDESIRLSPELAARAYLTHNELMFRHARQHRARGILANVSAIASQPEQFLEILAKRFDLDINVHAPSTFEGELMQNISPDAPRATLLRHLLPEIDQLYAELEREADLPSTTDEAKHPSARKVKNAFFNGWLLVVKSEDELKAHIDELKAHIDELKARIDELKARIDELKAHQDSLDARITELTETSEELEALHTAAEAREANAIAQAAELHVHLARRDAELAAARALSQEFEQRLEQTTRELVAQTEGLISATRAETARVEYLISTVESSSFWKLKRAINRTLRVFHLARR